MKKLIKIDELLLINEKRTLIFDGSINDRDLDLIHNILNTKSINEGLIKSFSTDKITSIIDRNFIDIEVEIDDINSIYLFGELDLVFNKLNKYINIFGWFISSILVDDVMVSYNSNLNYTNIKCISIEPKYDIEILNKPLKMYHSTLIQNLNSIKSNGLIPKSKSKIAFHPDRIYLTNSYEAAEQFKNYLENQFKKEACIIEVDSNGIDNLYQDVNWKENGFYTLNNISNKFLTFL